MSVMFPAMLIVLFVVALLLVGLVVLIVAAIKSKNATGLWVLVALIVAMVLIVPAGIAFLGYQRVQVADSAIRSQVEAQQQRAAAHSFFAQEMPAITTESSPTGISHAEWRPAAEVLPDAAVDFYPSQQEAERAVAAAIVTAYGRKGPVVPGDNDPRPLILTHAMDGPDTETYQPVADAVRNLGVTCRDVKPSISNHTHQYGIRLELTSPDASSPVGTYRAHDDRLDNPVSFAFTARYVDKPWLTDLSAFRIVNESPHLTVGFSEAPESTEDAARNAALRAVAAKLAPRIADERSPNTRYADEIMYPELDSIARNLQRFSLIDDQFTQQLERPYGTVYRHAVLVDATPDTIKRVYNGGNLTWVSHSPEQQLARGPTSTDPWLQDPAAAESADAQAEPLNPAAHYHVSTPSYAILIVRVLGLGALVGITLLIYRMLDHWTLGYRQGALTVTAVVVILGGAALLGLLLVA